jgi:hypothetical protein
MAPAVTAAVGAVTEVVLVAHGSPDPRHRRSATTLAHRMSASTGLAVTTCYLEHDGLQRTAAHRFRSEQRHRARGAALLTAGHWRTDIHHHRPQRPSGDPKATTTAGGIRVGELTQGPRTWSWRARALGQIVKRFADTDVLCWRHEVWLPSAR